MPNIFIMRVEKSIIYSLEIFVLVSVVMHARKVYHLFVGRIICISFGKFITWYNLLFFSPFLT
jgi:hypothetical protein